MKLFVAVYDDYTLLPHFLRHYSSLGIHKFHIAADLAIAPAIRNGVRTVNAMVRDDLDVVDSVKGGTQAVTEMRLEHSGVDEWVLIADLDEFDVLERSLADTISVAEAEGANVVRGRMIDRVSADGSLPAIDEDTDLWAAFPKKCRLTSLLQGSVDYKGVLVRGHLPATMAHHEFGGERLSQQEAQVHHFKWTSRVEDRVRAAMEMVRAAGIHWWPEYEKILNHLAQHGRIRWEDFVDRHA
jgi:hypothetical protein